MVNLILSFRSYQVNKYGQLKVDGEKATLEASQAHMILRFLKKPK